MIGSKINDGKDMFDLLVNSIGQPSNIDIINMYSIDHLLYDLATIIDHIDIKILEEQLIDLRTGSCPQGRSLRLIQVLQTCQLKTNEPVVANEVNVVQSTRNSNSHSSSSTT
jgi:hypothetical protein